MMRSSDSFSGSSTSGALPYLRAYASTRSYNSIGGGSEEDQQGNDGSQATGGGRGMIAWRAVGAVAVFLAFAAAVSTSNTRWMASGDHTLTGNKAAAVAGDSSLRRDSGGHSYRDNFETFEVSLFRWESFCLRTQLKRSTAVPSHTRYHGSSAPYFDRHGGRCCRHGYRTCLRLDGEMLEYCCTTAVPSRLYYCTVGGCKRYCLHLHSLPLLLCCAVLDSFALSTKSYRQQQQ